MGFAAATFLGAFLLFQVQPLIGKYILPWFGGGPAVWTTCMLFFQVLLLGGYAYAHLGSQRLTARTQAVLHMGLLLAALACLPIIPNPSWKPVSPDYPTWRILALLTICLGMPYFVLSATGPLMQDWFRRLNPGASPYRLYALSNLGSLLALLSYPFWFEPAFARKTQAVLWSWGMGVFALVCGWCAWRLWRSKLPCPAGPSPQRVGRGKPEGPPPRHWFFWLSLPACASLLLLAATNKLCQDVAVIPFLWVMPLALYLLSFILCFAGAKWYRRGWIVLLLWVAYGGVCVALFKGINVPIPLQVAAYAGAMFAGCMACHGELYRLRPSPRHLTAYYLMIAAGGALGGLFVGVLAPLLFQDFLEFELGLCLCLALLALKHLGKRSFVRLGKKLWVPDWAPVSLLLAAMAVILVIHYQRENKGRIASERNFYGVLKVFEYDQGNPRKAVRVLSSGNIIHGFQYAHPELAARPTAYYHEGSGVGLAWRLLPEQRPRRVGMVGLGVGTLAAYGRPGDVLRFYEINPDVLYEATTDFSYLSNSPARVEVILGDARLSLEREAPQEYDLLALDAFSGDAIPTHLLTREALEIYLRHLAPKGVLAVHITNRHVNLAPVLYELAVHFRLYMTYVPYQATADRPRWQYSAAWMLLTRDKSFLEQAAIQKAARQFPTKPGPAGLWTDDRASLLKLLR